MKKYISLSVLMAALLFGACSGGEKEIDKRFNYLRDLKTGINMSETEALFASHVFFFSGSGSEMKYDLDESEFHQKIKVKYNEEGKSSSIQITIDFSKHQQQLDQVFEQLKDLYANVTESSPSGSGGDVAISGKGQDITLKKSSEKINIEINPLDS